VYLQANLEYPVDVGGFNGFDDSRDKG